jgi:hypothetical protein
VGETALGHFAAGGCKNSSHACAGGGARWERGKQWHGRLKGREGRGADAIFVFPTICSNGVGVRETALGHFATDGCKNSSHACGQRGRKGATKISASGVREGQIVRTKLMWERPRQDIRQPATVKIVVMSEGRGDGEGHRMQAKAREGASKLKCGRDPFVTSCSQRR